MAKSIVTLNDSNIEKERTRPGRYDHRICKIFWLHAFLISGPKLEWTFSEIEPGNLGGVIFGAEPLRLVPEIGHEFRTHDPVHETRKVLYFRRQH